MPFHLGNGEQRTQFPLLHLNKLISVFCSPCLPSLRWPSSLSSFVPKSYIMSLNAHAYLLMADQLIHYDNFSKTFWFLLLSESHKLLEEIGTDQDSSPRPTLSSLGFVRGTDSPESPRNSSLFFPSVTLEGQMCPLFPPGIKKQRKIPRSRVEQKQKKLLKRGNDVKTCHTRAFTLG